MIFSILKYNDEILNAGVILAINMLKTKGILFQLNLLSLTPDSYGPEVVKMADKLLEDGLIDFVGTDVHNKRQLGLLKEIKVSKKLLTRLYPVIERTIQSFY